MKKKILISVVVGLIALLIILGIAISYKIKKDKENEVYVWRSKYIWFDEGNMTVVNDPKEIREGYKNRENANTWASFRKTFVIENKRDIKNVLARIVVDSKYWLYINDALVIKDGAVKRGETPISTYYDEVDITPYLTEGENTISILVWYFGRTGFSHVDSTHGALLFETKIGNEYIVSDDTWKCIQNPAFLKDDVVNNSRLSESGIYYDARLEIKDWYKKDFDDSSWKNARIYGGAGDYPWGALYERDIPQYKFGELTEYVNFEKYRNYTTKEDELIELELPYNMQIIPYLKVEAEEGKEIIISLDSNYTEKGKMYKIRYITKEGIQEFESYGWLNSEKMYYFIPKGVKIISLGYIPTGYNTEMVGSFECNDEFYNTLWDMAARTLYLNMRDTYMDCPDRERALWWGDASISMKQSMYVFDDNANALYDKCIDMLIGWKYEDVLLTVVPPERTPMQLPVQMLLSVSEMYNYYMYTGDITFLEKVYPHAKSYIELWQMSDQDGLMKLTNFHALWPWGDSVRRS